jgi:beta-lactamase regulating signal transducer with metallopeptidase domain
MISKFFADNASIQSALPILMDAALKGAVLVLVAAAAAYLLRKRSASSRHAVWTAAVIGHLAIPALVLILPAWTMPVLPPAPWMSSAPSAANNGAVVAPGTESLVAPVSGSLVSPSVQTPAAETKSKAGSTSSVIAATPQAPAPSAATPSAATPSAVTTPAARFGIVPVLATIWLVGALFVLLRLAIGTWKVNQLARDGARVEDGMWLSLAQRLANRLGVTRPLILLRGDRLAVPVTWGIVYPAVLLPQDSDTWTEERKRFVLVHEMAHVKRFDALTQLLAQFALAVFWFDPLVWIAAHQMRVEREHACDDYVLRDGTAPSLYAGELLEMVRSIGAPSHDQAAPAFAALAMARRSEFEGRMLAILDPRLDRQTMKKRGTLMTALIVALLTLPLAALRPFQQPVSEAPKPSVTAEKLPESFKISFGDASTPSAGSVTSGSSATPAVPVYKATVVAQGATTSTKAKWSCEAYPPGTTLQGTSTHIDAHSDGSSATFHLLISSQARCTEAAIDGKAKFSTDESRIAQLSPGGFARFRERTSGYDRAVTVLPVGDGSLSYSAMADGRTVPFDAPMVAWLGQLLPQVLREAAINVPERVARYRAQGGVPAVLQMISEIHSSSAKRAHYEELIKNGPMLSEADAERIAQQVGRDLTSSGDLSSVLKMLPIKAVQNPRTRSAISDALSHIASSGDKSSTLQVMAPNADAEMLLMLAKAAESLPSSGDKANFLLTTAAEYLNNSNASVRTAYFRTTSTLQSSGDMANVLISAIPYGHANSGIAMQVVETSKGLASSGDAANVLIYLASAHVLAPNTSRATVAAIQRTLTMASSGDRANVLTVYAENGLLSTTEIRDAYTKAALALPSDGDKANALAAAARR